ncbi:MAG: dTMP kinase [uncultured bacterium]|nr:MAG: dTMP kinase [uncultured bacterium]OGH13243.1 MAG: dTMP kinase [Candidatus Levybacteria bacterium RIFCSPHIGHO2_01_FULL_38_26]
MKYHIELDLDFRRNPHKGLYIAIEGIDGSGKTTQAERLAKYFTVKRKKVVATREPRKNAGTVGRLIGDILVSKVKVPFAAFQHIMSAERSIHHEELIIPSLKKGKIVITDRCFWSAVPYGILDRMKDAKDEKYSFNFGEVILVGQSILSMYHQFTVPDYTFYLDVSIDTAVERIGKKTERKELYEKKDKLEKISLGYKWLSKRFPKEITVIDGEKSEEEVTEEIVKKLT